MPHPHLIIAHQVLMDVVFNHTAEGNEMGPTISFRGFDNHVYYMIAPKVHIQFFGLLS
jgi:pullulanase/glycogen debranching enzyme